MSKHQMTLWLLIGVAVIGANTMLLSPILPDVAASFDTTALAVSRAIAAYGGATALSALFLGFMIDRHGAARVVKYSSLVLAAAVFVSAFSTGWVMLGAAQVLAGLAAGVMLPAIYAMAGSLGDEEEGARIMGRVLTGWALSLAGAVPLAAVITQYAGWRMSYIVLGVIIAGSYFGFSRLERCFTPISLTGQRQYLSPLQALALPHIWPLVTIQLLIMTAYYGVYSFFGDAIRTGLSVDAASAGLAVLAYGAGFGLAAVGDGLLDRLGPARVFALVLAISSGVYASMPLLATSFAGAVVFAFIWGATNHFVLTVIVLRLSVTGGEHRGAVMALNSGFTYIGALVGPVTFGLGYASEGMPALATGGALCLIAAAIVGFAHTAQVMRHDTRCRT